MDPEFIRANSDNLPIVTVFEAVEFVVNDGRYCSAEMRGIKQLRSVRQSYGDAAVGRVQLKRTGDICTVKGRVVPEHRVRSPAYYVELRYNEKENKVTYLKCDSCTAGAGGCKHALAFLFWVQRRGDDPSPTEVACYWKKPTLSDVSGNLKIKNTGRRSESLQPQPHIFVNMEDWLVGTTRHQCTLRSVLLDETEPGDLHRAMSDFVTSTRPDCKTSAEDFIQHNRGRVTSSVVASVEERTRGQSSNEFWEEVRYGRITGSRLHEIAHCHTQSGSLVEKICGGGNAFHSKAMERGIQLEKDVLAQVQREVGAIRSCGFYIWEHNPIFGASPDGLTEDSIVEVKCPTTAKSFSEMFGEGAGSPKIRAQMHLQMLVTGRERSILCLADPKFEENKNVVLIVGEFDPSFISPLITSAENFWKKSIFWKLRNVFN